jgi:uncharacterized protein YlxW (UPF0749 family)
MSIGSSSGSSPRGGGTHWLWQVTGLALFLGVLLGTSLRAQQNFRHEGMPISRYGVPGTIYTEMKKRNEDLSEEIRVLNEDKTRLTNAIAEGTDTRRMQLLNRELADTQAFAGLAAMEGPGVVVVLRDSPLKVNDQWPYESADYIVHDRDIFFIVNELRAAGAEAIAINDQRITAPTAIRCVGPVVNVNGTQVGLPLEIRAIGDPRALASGLTMQGGVLDANGQLVFLKMATVRREDVVKVPAFAGPTTFTHARRAKP